MKPGSTLTLLALAVVNGAACDIFTDADILAEYAYTEQTHGVVVADTVEITELGSEFYVQGQLNTPTPCYELVPTADRSGNRVTLKITSKKRSVTGCEQILGNYRYQAVFRYLDPGTYQVNVTHTFQNAERPDVNFDFAVNVR